MIRTTTPVPSYDPLILRGALCQALADIREAVSELEDDAYAVPAFGNIPLESSIGAHVRHVLDHIACLLGAEPQGVARYDVRDRGTSVETNRQSGLTALLEMEERVRSLTEEALEAEILVECLPNPTAAGHVFRSNMARELTYVTHHAIHHAALLRVGLRAAGVHPDIAFGVAPATLRYRNEQSNS